MKKEEDINTEMELIELRNISKSFKKNILKDINLKIIQGEILGLVGPSGQGKSVLIKTIIDFLKPTKGEINYYLNPRKIGFSMQENSIYFNLTIKQNWEYFGKLNNITKKEIKENTQRLLKELNLEKFKNEQVKNLSGGTKKRVDLGCALIHNPRLLVLDEPFIGLDTELINTLSRYLLYLNKRGVTIIISSHRIRELSRICKRMALIKNKSLKIINKSQTKGVYK